MKTVAIVSYDFSTRIAGGSIRAATFAARLPEYGWRPVVLTASPPDEHPVLPGGARAVYIPSGERSFGGGIREEGLGGNPLWLRALSVLKALVPLERQLTWHRPFRLRAAAAVEGQEPRAVVTVTAPYSMMPLGDRLARTFGVPHVVDLRDDWRDRYRIERRTAVNRFLMDRFSEHFLGRARAVTVVSPMTRERLVRRGFDARLVPNGFVERAFEGAPAEAKTLPAGRRLELVHLGWLGGFRTLAPVLEAVADLRRMGHSAAYDIRILQYGLVAPEERRRLEAMPASDVVQFRPQVPHEEAVRIMTQADVLLAIPGHEIPAAVSGKLYEYMRARRPILLVAGEGAARMLAREIGLSWVAHPDRVDEIALLLEHMHEARTAGTLRTAVPDELVSEYERGSGVRTLAGLLDEVSRP